MKRYAVRETITLIYYVEANDESEAIEKAQVRPVSDFDEIDSSSRGAHEHVAEEISD